MKHHLSILVLCLGVLLLIPGSARADEAAEAAPAPPPAAGTMRFSASPDAFPVAAKPSFTTGQTVYALVGFGGPWADSVKQATEKTSVVAMLLEGDRVLARSTLFPGERGFEATTFVLEVVPDPEKTTQYNHAFARALASLPAGTHQLHVKLWSLYGKKDPLALSPFTFEVTDQAWELLRRVSEKIQEAKKSVATPPRLRPSPRAHS
jgi:hypothetical protein